MHDYTTLITTRELEERLEAPDVRIVDCRFSLLDPGQGPAQYARGHIPGAVYAHLDDDLAAPISAGSGRHPLPDPDRFVGRLRDWGISNDSQVVVYDDASGGLAARLWWMLRWLGHDRVAVLDGGMAAWTALGFPVSDAVPDPVPGEFEGRPNADMIVTTAAVVDNLERNRFVLVDARDGARYRGEAEPIDSRAGHIPGSLSLPFTSSLDADGRWRAADELRVAWDALLAGRDGQAVAAMCGSGVTACHLALSAARAGLPEPKIYVGSWSEWIRDEARPVATGADLPAADSR